MFEDGESTHVENQVASISTRKTHIVPSVNNQLIIKDEIPSAYKLDMHSFIKRPFYLGTASWSENNAQYTLLDLPVVDLPADVILSNESLYQAVKVGSLMKPFLKMHVSLNGTISHAGCLLIGILPPGINYAPDAINVGNTFVNLVNTILSGPHVQLYANEATSAILEVPWYCNTDMCEAYVEDLTDVPPGILLDNVPLILNSDIKTRSRGSACYATIVALVLNPLRPGGGSVPLTLVMEAVFEEFELAVPTPRFIKAQDWIPQSSQPIWKQVTSGLMDLTQVGAKAFYPFYGDAIDRVRGLIKHFTGLHNPNIPSIENRVITTHANLSKYWGISVTL